MPMKYTVCSPGMKQFFEYMMSEAKDLSKINQQLQTALNFVADEIHLGKLVCKVKEDPSVFNPKGYQDMMEYNRSECEPSMYTKVFPTGAGGTVSISAYPVKGYRWREEELQEVEYLLETIYVLYGRIRVNGMVQKAVLTDNVTGAANLSGFMRFGAQLEQQGRLGEYIGIFMNIKNFKYINQSIGSRNGDQFLRKYHYCISEFLEKDEMFGRPGGDNFVLLVKKERIMDVMDFLSDISIGIPMGKDEQKFDVNVRMGIYDIQPEDSMSHVLNCMSAAVNVTRHGRSRDYVWFEPEMLANTMRNREIAEAFPMAMRKEEFEVYYQPQVNLETSEICGMEALVRWRREGRLLLPEEFIPILEKVGSICELDFYVLAQICQLIQSCQEEGIELVPISVNFSGRHLANQSFMEEMIAIMQAFEISGEYLGVEFSEKSMDDNYEALAHVVDSMKVLGIHTAIDDYGTGNSSMKNLQSLSVDEVKLDGAFLQEASEDAAFLKNIIRMITELGIELSVEDVEKEEEKAHLLSLGCKKGQGFLFYEPMEAEKIKKVLAK